MSTASLEKENRKNVWKYVGKKMCFILLACNVKEKRPMSIFQYSEDLILLDANDRNTDID